MSANRREWMSRRGDFGGNLMIHLCTVQRSGAENSSADSWTFLGERGQGADAINQEGGGEGSHCWASQQWRPAKAGRIGVDYE